MGGSRGGRGRGRRGLSARDSTKAEDDIYTKPDNSQPSTSPSTKSSISSSVSTPVPGKPNVPAASSSKPKLSSRRASRAISVTAVPQTNEVVVSTSASKPTPAKLSHKRRSSQVRKPALHVPPKPNPPTLNDSPLRSKKPPSLESRTEPLKDLPPHLNGRFDARNDIDALVERVRAVAMDNRPSTPKNHIDWAVDDDDTLPDLDDWGVTTSALTTTQLEVISPIIVDGLRSLPEFAANSTIPSPLKQVEPVMVQPTIDLQSRSVNDMTFAKIVHPSLLSTKDEDMKSEFSTERTVRYGPQTTLPPNSKMKALQSNASISLNLSLPVKPVSVDSIVQHISKPRPRASPMRFVPHPKSPITPMIDLSGMPAILPTANSEQTNVQALSEVSAEMTGHKTATMTLEPGLEGPEHLIIVEPTATASAVVNVHSDRGDPDYTRTAQEPSPCSLLNGLGASMHAPKGMVDSISAPANLSTYADSRTHDPIYAHMRAHTVGRSPLPDSTIHGQDYTSRFTRSGHTTPRGAFQGKSHARTHSTPPGGASHHRSPQTSRPVITGDAISKLARTIGKPHNNLSPPKSHSVVTPGN